MTTRPQSCWLPGPQHNVRRRWRPTSPISCSAVSDSTDLEDAKQGYISFPCGEELELFISETADGRLNLSEIFMIDGEESGRIKPKITGDIETEPALYQSVPVEAFYSGDVMKGMKEEYKIEHVVLVRVRQEEPYELDFRSVYCFDCAKQEFYRVEPIPLHASEYLTEPILRFQPQDGRFLIDDLAAIPPPELVVAAHEAKQAGWDMAIDAAATPADPEAGSASPQGADEDEDDFLDRPELDDVDDTPDVPAVDLA